MATGQTAAALPVLQAWKAVDPRGAECSGYLSTLGIAEAKPELVPQPGSAVPPGGSRRLRIDAPNPAVGSALPVPKLSPSDPIRTH
jgi:hypothetical protein